MALPPPRSWSDTYTFVSAAASSGDAALCGYARECVLNEIERVGAAKAFPLEEAHNVMLCRATSKGHSAICLKALQWGATSLNEMLWRAASTGNRSLCVLAREHGAVDFGAMLEGAVYGAHYELCLLAGEWGADPDGVTLNVYLRSVGEASRDETEAKRREVRMICGLLLQWGASEVDLLLESAAECGDRDLCCLARERGATDFEAMLKGAAASGNRELCLLAREWGANPPGGALDALMRKAMHGGDSAMCACRVAGRDTSAAGTGGPGHRSSPAFRLQ